MQGEYGQIVLYQREDGASSLEVHLKDETVWLSLKQIAELFDRDKSVISRHLNKTFKSGELNRDAVVAKNATTAADGKTYQVDYFNLDAIISVAYGYSDASKMNGGVSGEWDFDLAIGAKLGDFLKGLKGIGKAVDTIQKYKKIRYLTEVAIKNRGIASPGIFVIPIPLAGGGIHAWAGFKFGDITIFQSGKGIP